jgi:alpha-tubulin suppressor-like RCC1 family protein
MNPLFAVGIAFVALTGGDNLGCGLTAAGEAYCWGNNEYGQVGSPPLVECTGLQCADPPRRVASEVPFTRIDAGHAHVCALDRSGAAYCWGNNNTGALGTEAALDDCAGNDFLPPPDLLRGCSQRPLPVDGGLSFTSITAGSTLTCALTAPGDVYCWGMAGSGSDRTIHRTPRKLVGGGPYRSVSAEHSRVCAVDADGRAHCWSRWDSQPPEVVPAPERFVSISLGWGHACALTATGTAYCWGDNDAGQVGSGRDPRRDRRVGEPTPVAGLRRYAEIFAGFQRTCAIAVDAALYCWGADAGQPGTPICSGVDALFSCTPAPVRVTDQRFRSVGLGLIHSCAVTIEGAGYCWGRSYHGGFGDGRTGVITKTPVRMDWGG